MKPARYYVRRADGVAFPTGAPESDSEARARGYAEHWARVCRTDVEVRDRGTGDYGVSWTEGAPTGWIIYTAKAKSDHGVPLARPLNAPPADAGPYDLIAMKARPGVLFVSTGGIAVGDGILWRRV